MSAISISSLKFLAIHQALSQDLDGLDNTRISVIDDVARSYIEELRERASSLHPAEQQWLSRLQPLRREFVVGQEGPSNFRQISVYYNRIQTNYVKLKETFQERFSFPLPEMPADISDRKNIFNIAESASYLLLVHSSLNQLSEDFGGQFWEVMESVQLSVEEKAEQVCQILQQMPNLFLNSILGGASEYYRRIDEDYSRLREIFQERFSIALPEMLIAMFERENIFNIAGSAGCLLLAHSLLDQFSGDEITELKRQFREIMESSELSIEEKTERTYGLLQEESNASFLENISELRFSNLGLMIFPKKILSLFPGLRLLNISDNSLTSIDVSKNPYLRVLITKGNPRDMRVIRDETEHLEVFR